MASRARGHGRRSMHPQLHSSLSCLAWPMTHWAFSQPPSPLCFLPLSSLLVLTWTGHSYTKGPVCHRNQGSLKTSGGNRSRAVPGQGWPPNPVMSATSCNPVEMLRDREKGGEGPSSAGTSFQGLWHFFCVAPDRSRLNSSGGVGHRVWRQWRSFAPDENRK